MKQRTRSSIQLAPLAIAAFVLLTACGGTSATVGGQAKDQAGSASSAPPGALNLGAVLPLTGASATIGEDQRRGIELAVDKAPVVIGEYSAGVTIPMGQFLQRRGIVHINPGSSSPHIAKIGTDSFSTIGLDTIASKFTAQELYRRGYRRPPSSPPTTPTAASSPTPSRPASRPSATSAPSSRMRC